MHCAVCREYAADPCSVTHEFTLNGLKHANKLLGYEAFKPTDWEAVGEYDEEGGRHRAFVVPKTDVTVSGVALKQGEKVRIEESYKYSQAQSAELWRTSGAYEHFRFDNDAGDYGMTDLSSMIISLTKVNILLMISERQHYTS